MNRDSIFVFAFSALILVSACKKEAKPKEEGLRISGTIEIDPALLKQAQDSDVIFLMARPGEGGPPAAVMKFTGRNYPYPFTLTQANLMMPESEVDGPLNLTVRVDKDGDPMTKMRGDLIGGYDKNPAPIDAQNVAVKINQVLK